MASFSSRGSGVGLPVQLAPVDGQSHSRAASSARAQNSFDASRERLLPADNAQEHQMGQDVAETVPARREVMIVEDPIHAVDIHVAKFEPHIILDREKDLMDLDFRPTILKIGCMLSLTTVYVATAVAVGVLWWKHQFHISSENVHMIARYFPAIVGTITVLLFQSTVREYLRIKPFIAMADQNGKIAVGAVPWKSVGGGFFPWQDVFITPGIISILSLVMQFVVSFVVSMKVALFATQADGDGTWTLTVRTVPAGSLVCGYILMISYNVSLAIALTGKSTGLKWDPVSIADFQALFSKCNALDYFAPLELRHDIEPKHAMSDEQYFRLGYWNKRRTNEQNEVPEIVYGIGVTFGHRQHQENEASYSQAMSDSGKATGQKQKGKHFDPLPMTECSKTGRGCDCKLWPKCEHYPYRHNPGVARWYLILCILVIWSALGASVYALVKGWPMNGFHVPNNWSLPVKWDWTTEFHGHTIYLGFTDPHDPKSTLLIYALIFRSVPTYFAGFFINTIIPSIDLNMRFIQPFAEMLPIVDNPGLASRTVLLDYITLSSLQVPLTAYDNGHYKVSWFSTLHTLSPLFPIFIGGLLTVTGEGDRVLLQFSLSAYIGIMFSLVLYSFSLPFAHPHAHRLLPRQFYSMADLMAMCYASRFMSSPHLDITHRRLCPTKAHMEARILNSHEEFLFGMYKGRDNEMHLGFDVASKESSEPGALESTGLVHWLKPATTWRDKIAWKPRNKRIRANTVMLEHSRKGRSHQQQQPSNAGYAPAERARKVHQEYEMNNLAGQTSGRYETSGCLR